MDRKIGQRFQGLWASLRGREAAEFVSGRANVALAAVLLFDQFPRNMFRGAGTAFATDGLALRISDMAIAEGLDRTLTEERRHFLYMPFMHSEDMADQQRSLRLFAALGNERALKFAQEHADIVSRFGRFPHRNTVLNGETRPEERAAVEKGAHW